MGAAPVAQAVVAPAAQAGAPAAVATAWSVASAEPAQSEVVLAGELRAVPLLDVLRLLALQRQSGVLLVLGPPPEGGPEQAALQVSVVFVRGQVA